MIFFYIFENILLLSVQESSLSQKTENNNCLIFLLLTFYWHYSLPMGKLSYNDKLHEQRLGEKAIISSYHDKGWKL